MGNTCKPMAVSFQCMTKSTTIKKIKKKKKETAPWVVGGIPWRAPEEDLEGSPHECDATRRRWRAMTLLPQPLQWSTPRQIRLLWGGAGNSSEQKTRRLVSLPREASLDWNTTGKRELPERTCGDTAGEVASAVISSLSREDRGRASVHLSNTALVLGTQSWCSVMT